jgi:hypothetical protein
MVIIVFGVLQMQISKSVELKTELNIFTAKQKMFAVVLLEKILLCHIAFDDFTQNGDVVTFWKNKTCSGVVRNCEVNIIVD